MHRQRHQFPLIPDGQPCLQEPVVMRLYENEDLITNIRSPYQDKDYNDVVPYFDSIAQKTNVENVPKSRLDSHEEGISYAEQAREQAKRDLREKRQKFLQQEMQPTKHGSSRSMTTKRPSQAVTDALEVTVDTAVTTDKTPVTASKLEAPISKLKRSLNPKGKHSNIHRLADRLQQDTYILAELTPTYQQPNNPSRKEIKKNNYDFLKRSQVYNYPERQYHREYQVAQELNLTHLEDAN